MFRRQQHLVFPLALALHLVLRLVGDDSDPLRLSSGLRALVLMVLLTVILLWLLKPIFPGPGKRSVLVGTFYLLFFNYTLWLLRSQLTINALGVNQTIMREAITLAALAPLIILLLMAYVTYKSKSDFRTTTAIGNIFALVFLSFSLVEIIRPPVTGATQRWQAAADSLAGKILDKRISPTRDLPDIYYVILDGYARSDVLEELYDSDNSQFINYLEAKGFFVPSGSRSNYIHTYLSLASSLNLSYLDELQKVMGTNSQNRRPLQYLIQDKSAVAGLLRRAGYRYIFLGTRYSATSNSTQADVCFCKFSGLNDLENRLVLRTPLAILQPINAFQHLSHAKDILNAFRDLAETSKLPGPKFVFAHVIAPHPPFVLGPQGQDIIPAGPCVFNDGSHYFGSHQDYLSKYRDQVTYVNTKIRETVDAILAQSRRPPIIILQADHGPGSMLNWESVEKTNTKERSAIFAAYYLPAEIKARYYDSITPINAFRILFNDLLGTNYPMLPDRSFFSPWIEPYAFVDITPKPYHARTISASDSGHH